MNTASGRTSAVSITANAARRVFIIGRQGGEGVDLITNM
jgi:hypothetical protein